MDLESILIALAVAALLGLGYWLLRRRTDAQDSSPEHFFGGMDEETALMDLRSRSAQPKSRAGEPRR